MFSPSEQTPASDARGEKHAFQFGLLVYLTDPPSAPFLFWPGPLDRPGWLGEAFERTAKVAQKQQSRITIYFYLVVARGFSSPSFLLNSSCFLIMALDLEDLSISPCKMLYHLLGGGSAW